MAKAVEPRKSDMSRRGMFIIDVVTESEEKRCQPQGSVIGKALRYPNRFISVQ